MSETVPVATLAIVLVGMVASGVAALAMSAFAIVKLCNALIDKNRTELRGEMMEMRASVMGVTRESVGMGEFIRYSTENLRQITALTESLRLLVVRFDNRQGAAE